MAITIYDKFGFRNKLIPHFIDGDSAQLDPCFAAFKRISSIIAYSEKSDSLIANLRLFGKASTRIDLLFISKDVLNEMIGFYTDKEVDLIIENLEISYFYKDNISDEDAEFINKISPKMLTINGNVWTVENIKMLVLINCNNIDAYYCNFLSTTNSSLWFVKTTIQLFDSKSNQRLIFEWESIKFVIKNI